MNITIHGSNSLENLAGQLSKELKHQQNHVFQPQYIVTQTEGMNNWLKIKMAEHLGIVANCRFLKPNDLINEIYYKLGASGKQALSARELQWILFTLLALPEFMQRFPAIARYFNNDDVKRMALAKKTADLFDQYQIYRPDMIRKWNQGDGKYEGINGWQKYLWMSAKKATGEAMADKTVIGKHITEALKKPEQQRKLVSLIPNIHVFGLSIITSYHVQLFYELARVINVSVHLLNPAPSIYWQEDKSEKQLSLWKQSSAGKLMILQLPTTGNTLLSNWGRVLQDTFGLFFESDELINRYHEVTAVEPAPESLLGKIQNDIFNNYPTAERNPLSASDISDGSITVNACYTIAREVEVLYNYLVHLTDEGGEALAPRDVVVMVSDIDAYAPYVKAVFNAAPYKFPFTVADESFAISDNLFSAIHSIFSLTEETFTAEEVLQLLESGMIRKRFGITDIQLIRKAVDAANIRFGIAGSKEDDTIFVSWKNGINRIMYGICMSGGDEYNLDGLPLYPLDMSEGVEALELIRFCHFAQVLISTIEERRKVRTITEWGEYIEQVADKLIYLPDDSNDDDYQLLMKSLEGLHVVSEIVTDKIPFEVFRHSFVDPLSSESRSSVFASGGITFCSLIPMRSIPFKVVALLGLDFDKFPRNESRSGFNIMEQERRRKGDRNVKENDKHLFLETILSAQKYLYISYLGRSSKDNSPKPPSALVDELIDYIQSGMEDRDLDVKQALVTTHPLHGFSQKYYQKIPGLYNYLNGSEIAGGSTKKRVNNNAGSISFEEVATEVLIRFFKNPFKAYYNRTLGVRYGQDDVLLPENEVFEMDSLQNWRLKQDLLFSKPGALAAYRKKGIATGELPLKNMADHVLNSTEKDLSLVREMVREAMGGASEENINIELLLDGSLLKGSIPGIYGNRLIIVSFSKNQCKYLLEGSIKYLLLSASGRKTELYFISSGRKIYKIPANHTSRKDALAEVGKLMKLYKQGHEKILMFFPNFEKSPSAIASLNQEEFAKMIRTYFDMKDFKNENKGMKDAYLEKERSLGFFEEPGLWEEYKRNSLQIFSGHADFYDDYYRKEGNTNNDRK